MKASAKSLVRHIYMDRECAKIKLKTFFPELY